MCETDKKNIADYISKNSSKTNAHNGMKSLKKLIKRAEKVTNMNRLQFGSMNDIIKLRETLLEYKDTVCTKTERVHRMLTVAQTMFDTTAVAGIKPTASAYSVDADITVLLNGRVEFNSYFHRRDMVDVMLEFNLYVKRLTDGMYQSGVHDTTEFVVSDTPNAAITDMAYMLVLSTKQKF